MVELSCHTSITEGLRPEICGYCVSLGAVCGENQSPHTPWPRMRLMGLSEALCMHQESESPHMSTENRDPCVYVLRIKVTAAQCDYASAHQESGFLRVYTPRIKVAGAQHSLVHVPRIRVSVCTNQESKSLALTAASWAC